MATCNEIVCVTDSRNRQEWVVCRMTKYTEHTHQPPEKSRKATPSEVTDGRIAELREDCRPAFASR